MATAGTFGNHDFATTELANSNTNSLTERGFMIAAMCGSVCGAIVGAVSASAAGSIAPELIGLFGTLAGSVIASTGWSLIAPSASHSE